MTTDERIEQLDLSLFSYIPTTTPGPDLQTLLAIQSVTGKLFPQFSYLEIGSFMGGSLQQFVVDKKCERIVSIDPRPGDTPDVRGTQAYGKTSALAMLEALRQVPGADVAKIKTIDASAADLNEKSIDIRPQLCFIDGEHTNEAALTDARFCLSVMAKNGIMAFHDSNLVFHGLRQFLDELASQGLVFRPYILPDSIFLIEFGETRCCELEPLRSRWQQNYKAYLAGMAHNDWYREAYRWSLARYNRNARTFYMSKLRPRLSKVKRLFLGPKTVKA